LNKERVKRYFIDAALEIISEEGVKGISTRKVAEKAEYSYATIYNYFKDVNELLAYCVVEYFNQLENFIFLDEELKNTKDIEKLKYMLILYAKFFIMYPEKFALVFLEDFGEIFSENLSENLLKPKVIYRVNQETYNILKEKNFNDYEIERILSIISTYINGTLLFYLKRNFSLPNEEVLELVKKDIDFMFENFRRKIWKKYYQ